MKDLKERKQRNISIIVTERCNLSCVYCYEDSKSAKQITFEVAKKI
jgi:molybdenum cofactor biosynthesis enzyme MoaA